MARKPFGAWFGDRPAEFLSAWFVDLDTAEVATLELLASGFPRERITVLLSEETRDRYLEGHPERGEFGRGAGEARAALEAEEGEPRRRAGAGGGGGVIGAVGAAVAAVGTAFAIPALGIVVAGPLAVALTGAGAGGALGTIIGALTGSGMDEYRARRFEELVREGRIIIGVHALSVPETQEVREILEQEGGVPIGDSEAEG